LADLKEFAFDLKPWEMVRMLGPTLSGGGLAKINGVMHELRRVLGDTRIEDCSIPYTAVASDIVSQEEVWLTTGPIVAAVRASVAIPVLFTPVVRDGRLLSDGGCVNPLPIEPLRPVDADVIVAVSLYDPPTSPPTSNGNPRLNLATTAIYAIDTSLSSIQRARLVTTPPDVLIGIPSDLVGFLDMHRAADVISAAEGIAVKALDEAGL
ncbi:MAG: patatin-like phospholipase family protein, partial [Propionibacteriaceae bacterium]|nr:patatin-like phospholipase family protein [Propionibacteriaceae bacterium]